MDHIFELTNALADLEQQLRMRQLDDEHQIRVTTQVRSQVWKPYASMDYAQYGLYGKPIESIFQPCSCGGYWAIEPTRVGQLVLAG